MIKIVIVGASYVGISNAVLLAQHHEVVALDIDPAKITMESDIMSDFEADSLDIVDMVMTLEDEFGIEVPDDAIETLRTVGDVVNFVDSHQG